MALNICLVSFRFPITARATDQGFLWPLARGLAAKGHKVTILAAKSYMGKAYVQRDGVEVFYLYDGYPNFSHLPFSEAVFLKFKELHKKERFNLVHSFDRSGYFIARRKREFGVQVAFDVEATQISKLFAIMSRNQENLSSLLSVGLKLCLKFLSTYFGGDRELSRLADGFFVTSPQQKQFLERYYLYPERRIHSVPYGIDSASLNAPENRRNLRELHSIPTHAKLILVISDMLVPEEIFPILQAIEKVAIKKPDIHLALISTAANISKKVEHEMLKLALASKVTMLAASRDEEISEWIADSDIYINLSPRSSGFEPTLLEAMAQRKVVIGSELSAMAYVLEDGQDGFLLRPADVESLAQLLFELVSGNIEAMDVGSRAREKVLNLFEPSKMVEALDQSYSSLSKDGFF